MKRIEALAVLADLTSRHPVVVTCAATSRELASVKDADNHLYLLDAMGLAGSVATGLALSVDPAAPKVVGIEGDGSLFMNPNVLPTGGYLAPDNLLLVLLDNGVYGSTGGCRPTRRGSASTGWRPPRDGPPGSRTPPTGCGPPSATCSPSQDRRSCTPASRRATPRASRNC